LSPLFCASFPTRERRSRLALEVPEEEALLAALEGRHLVDDGRPLGEEVEEGGVDPVERRPDLRELAHG
jgi:hypothetical protein